MAKFRFHKIAALAVLAASAAWVVTVPATALLAALGYYAIFGMVNA